MNLPKDTTTIRDALQIREYLRWVNERNVIISQDEANRLTALIPKAEALLMSAIVDVSNGAMTAIDRSDMRLAMTLAR